MPLVKKKKQPQAKSIFLVSTIVIVIIGYFAFTTYQSLTEPVSETTQLVNFEVVEGDTMSSVLARLENEGHIRNRYVARWMLRNQDFLVYKGNFMLDTSTSVNEMMTILSNPALAIQNTVRITLPPGFWAKDMAKRISTFTSVSEDELLSAWNDETYVQSLISEFPVLTEAILTRKDDVKVLLEGYLSPNTYEFFVETTVDAITRVLINETQRIYTAHKTDFDQSQRSIHDIFVMASIVEYEASEFNDMKMVAGVFYNRLNINMRLQSSVTVCYALYEFEDWRDCESYENQQINSPYNTYVVGGLPAGPILNPSENAIIATLNYEPSRYFYFLADVYGDGTVYYAETFAQHQANIDKYLRR
jgi:UPF0755 protein